VPALVTDAGESLVESGCICDYLDEAGSGRRLMPRELPARLPALRKYGLGRGLIDVAFGVTIQRRFAAPCAVVRSDCGAVCASVIKN
jgi:glutathione S-transferase